MTTYEGLNLYVIRQRLADYSVRHLVVGDNRHAAVAMVLRQTDLHVELLLIERARRNGDPWSGQMGFPGGMVAPSDYDAQAAAERETGEEIGLTLAAHDYLGRIDDMQGRHRGHPSGIIVSAYVYGATSGFVPKLNHEVRDVLWVPLTVFSEQMRGVEVRHPAAPGESFPGIRVSDNSNQIVWGLTHRFVETFFGLLDVNFIGAGKHAS